MKKMLIVAGLSALALVWGCENGSSNAGSGNSSGQPPTVQTTQTPAIMLSASSFDFGDNLVSNTDTQTVVTVTNSGSSSLTLAPGLTGDGSFSLASSGSCGTQLSAGASCNEVVAYPPAAAGQQATTLNLNPSGVAADTASTVAITGTSAVLTAGTVTPTNNPQVALYTITPPFAGNVTINFGRNTSYGLNTWAVPADGSPTKIYVAGMLANTEYHMQASVALANGVTATDVDHTFTTTAYPANILPHITATTMAGQTPQAGIEVMDQLYSSGSNVLSAYATDLAGNLIWAYNIPDADSLTTVQGVKFMSNGHVALL